MASPSVSILLKKHDFGQRNRLAFASGAQIVFDILRGGFIQMIVLRLRGDLVVSGGTVNGAVLGENPGNLVTQVIMDASPVGQIVNLTPRSLIRSTMFDWGRQLVGTALTGAAGTFTLDQDYYLPFGPPTMPRPIECSLQTEAFASIQLRATCGTRDTQFTGNDRTFNFAAVTLDVLDQREFMAGQTALLFQYDLVRTIAAANPAFTISDWYVGRRILQHLYSFETTNQALADTILNANEPSALVVQSGNAVFARGSGLDYRAFNVTRISDAAQTMTGVRTVFLSPDMTLEGAIDARQLSQIQTQFNFAAPGAGADRVIAMSREVLLAGDLSAGR